MSSFIYSTLLLLVSNFEDNLLKNCTMCKVVEHIVQNMIKLCTKSQKNCSIIKHPIFNVPIRTQIFPQVFTSSHPSLCAPPRATIVASPTCCWWSSIGYTILCLCIWWICSCMPCLPSPMSIKHCHVKCSSLILFLWLWLWLWESQIPSVHRRGHKLCSLCWNICVWYWGICSVAWMTIEANLRANSFKFVLWINFYSN